MARKLMPLDSFVKNDRMSPMIEALIVNRNREILIGPEGNRAAAIAKVGQDTSQVAKETNLA